MRTKLPPMKAIAAMIATSAINWKVYERYRVSFSNMDKRNPPCGVSGVELIR